jgi:hypothetical protein
MSENRVLRKYELKVGSNSRTQTIHNDEFHNLHPITFYSGDQINGAEMVGV